MTASVDKIVVLGTGYVGLPLALVLAKAGKAVVGVDIDEGLVQAINDGSLNLEEPELRAMLQDPEVKRNLRATTAPEEADAFVISVPTPLDGRRKVADLRYVVEAVDSIVPHLRPGNVVVLESTVPPLTTRKVVLPRIGPDVLLAHCPERILPGNVFHEIVHNDRVIGGRDAAACEAAAKVYEPFLKGALYFTDDVTAEVIKLMENTYRDVNVALANELGLVADFLGVDIEEARRLANMHPRVDILQPGIGVGGHCLPIDPWFLAEVAPEVTPLIVAARRVNDRMPERMAGRVRRFVRSDPTGTILAIGLAYKPGTYDARESPARRIVALLRADGYHVVTYDPFVEEASWPSLAVALEELRPSAVVVLVPHVAVVKELAEAETFGARVLVL